jgi:hypothetical protein
VFCAFCGISLTHPGGATPPRVQYAAPVGQQAPGTIWGSQYGAAPRAAAGSAVAVIMAIIGLVLMIVGVLQPWQGDFLDGMESGTITGFATGGDRWTGKDGWLAIAAGGTAAAGIGLCLAGAGFGAWIARAAALALLLTAAVNIGDIAWLAYDFELLDSPGGVVDLLTDFIGNGLWLTLIAGVLMTGAAAVVRPPVRSRGW